VKGILPNVANEQLLRELAPQLLGAVVRRFRDFGEAEDAVQEALMAALSQWPREGIPENSRGWLIHVAVRRMTGQLRSEIALRQREISVAMDTKTLAASDPIETDMDLEDTLILLFMSGHPVLTPSSAIALTLRAVGGLTTAEIAKAFLVPETIMAQQISCAPEARGKPAAEEWMSNSEGFLLAYAGQLRVARKISGQAEEFAREAEQKETEALYETDFALREALFGNTSTARQSATAAVRLSRSRDVEYGAAFALVFSRELSGSQSFADDLSAASQKIRSYHWR
jgi:DNA-directed RNA polymerase specialized sigma24 family protein